MLLIKHEKHGLMEHRDGQEDLEKKLADGWVIVDAKSADSANIVPIKRKPGRPRK